MNKISAIILIFTLSISACKNESTTKTEEVVENTGTEVKDVVKKIYKVYPFSPSVSYDNARIDKMNYSKGKFSFTIPDGEYQLGVQTPDADQKMCANSAEGQHIHLIVDNEPYAAKYESSFDYEIEDGDHHLLAFLSRSYHESIKEEKAYVAMNTSIKNNSIVDSKPISEPALFYSRPKGVYVGQQDTKKIMLDFYVLNVELGDHFKVVAKINNEEHVLDKWQPYYIEGLPLGENTINLKLVDGNGKMVNTPINDVTRTFELKADLPKESMAK